MREIDEDIMNAALQTYKLEKSFDPDSNAMEAAIRASLVLHEQRVMEQVAIAAEELSEYLKNEDEPSLEAAAALAMFAHDLRGQIPVVDRDYIPENDDLVEVMLTGEVSVYSDECPKCGHEIEGTTWSVTDRSSGMEYHFDPKESKGLKVRKISPGTESFLSPVEVP